MNASSRGKKWAAWTAFFIFMGGCNRFVALKNTGQPDAFVGPVIGCIFLAIVFVPIAYFAGRTFGIQHPPTKDEKVMGNFSPPIPNQAALTATDLDIHPLPGSTPFEKFSDWATGTPQIPDQKPPPLITRSSQRYWPEIAFPIIAGLGLPLLATFLHPEISAALSGNQWSYVVGLILGRGGIFAVLAGVMATAFALNSRLRDAWVSVAIATVVSGVMAGSSGVVKGRMETMIKDDDARKVAEKANTEILLEASEVQKITAWTQQHQSEVVVTLSNSQLAKVISWRYQKEPLKNFSPPVSGMKFKGSINNRSAEKISSLVIDYGIYNRDQLILSRRFKIPLEVFPTVNLAFDQEFSPYGASSETVIDEFYRAAVQMGAGWAWNYRLVAIIPESLDDYKVANLLKVDAEFRLNQ